MKSGYSTVDWSCLIPKNEVAGEYAQYQKDFDYDEIARRNAVWMVESRRLLGGHLSIMVFNF